MKAGIYKTPNGNLIYVAKDRTIKATTLKPSSWPGTKVTHRSKDDTVLIEGTDYRCTRVADVPNGCNDPEKALLAYVETTAEHEAVAEVQHPHLHTASAQVLFLDDRGLLIDDIEARKELRRNGYRLCHAQSARKHRRRGREVVYVPEIRQHAWRMQA